MTSAISLTQTELCEPRRIGRRIFMHRYGYKTKRDAYKNLDWCLAKIFDGNISIQPYRRHRPNYWKNLPSDRTVVIPATDDPAAVGAALRLALNRGE